jgi:hypothetical protein
VGVRANSGQKKRNHYLLHPRMLPRKECVVVVVVCLQWYVTEFMVSVVIIGCCHNITRLFHMPAVF